MGFLARFYEQRVFPWLNDKLTNTPELIQLRKEALSTARGDVVEIGFGTGSNLAYYPSGVESITGIEPNQGMRDRAAGNISSARQSVKLLAGEAEQIPLPAGSADVAVTTLTLCTVSDPSGAVRELHRVLRPGGHLIVVEHGLSEDPEVALRQRRLNRIQKIVACGCNLNRPISDIIVNGGFAFESVRKFYLHGAPRTHGWLVVGRAARVG